MPCNSVFDLEAIEALAPTTGAGLFQLSGLSWLVLQAAMAVVSDYDYWCGQWGSGEALTESERNEIDAIVSEVQQAISEVMTSVEFTDVQIVPESGNVTPFTMTAEMQMEMLMTVYADTVVGTSPFPAMVFRRATGDSAAPDVIANGDIIGSINWRGYSGSSFQNGALLRVIATETWTPTTRGTDMLFYTIPTGTSAIAVGMTLHNDKRLELEGTLDHDGTLIGLNGSTPIAKGTITGSRAGNAALASLLTYLASRGDIIDSTTA